MWVFLLALLGAPAAAADCDDTDAPWDTGLDDADCDEDTWTKRAGDCNDFDPDVNPGQEEVCGDFEDNDCNGYFNDGCDDAAQRGSLLGGSTCATGAVAPWLLLPLALAPLVARRRRR